MAPVTSPTPSAEMEKLAGCPFCGGPAYAFGFPGGKLVPAKNPPRAIGCPDCQLFVGDTKGEDGNCIARWNRRPSDPVRADLVEALEAEWEKWVDDLRVVYPDNEVLESFSRLRDILTRAEAGSPRPTSTRREVLEEAASAIEGMGWSTAEQAFAAQEAAALLRSLASEGE